MHRFLYGLAALGLCLTPNLSAAGLSGAIFTTTANGAIVNANTQYNSKCDVYLDGGPGPNAPAKAAGLPAGDYFFQVTDPSGQTLLSTDPVSNRRFTISSNGVIVAFTGVGGPIHPTGVDQDHGSLGALTIRLANLSCPTDFLDTPNNGGVYKVWATRVADFSGDITKVDNPCSGGGCFHGFISSKSKTDDFKARATVATFCLSVVKTLLFPDGSTSPGVNWEIRLTDPLAVSNTYYTNATGSLQVCDLTSGAYTVEEINQTNFSVSGLTVNGLALPPDVVYAFTWTADKPAPQIAFQNTYSVSDPDQ